jgi:hypothetical protein
MTILRLPKLTRQCLPLHVRVSTCPRAHTQRHIHRHTHTQKHINTTKRDACAHACPPCNRPLNCPFPLESTHTCTPTHIHGQGQAHTYTYMEALFLKLGLRGTSSNHVGLQGKELPNPHCDTIAESFGCICRTLHGIYRTLVALVWHTMPDVDLYELSHEQTALPINTDIYDSYGVSFKPDAKQPLQISTCHMNHPVL